MSMTFKGELRDGEIRDGYARISGMSFKVMSEHEGLYDLSYKGTYVPNVSKESIENNCVPIADVLKHIGEEYDGKVISGMTSMNDVQVKFPDGTTQAGYAYKDVPNLTKPVVAPEPVCFEADPKSKRNLSYEMRMANGRKCRVDMSTADYPAYAVYFTDGLKECKFIRKEMVNLLYYTNNGVQSVIPEMHVRMKDDSVWHVESLEKNGVFLNIFKMGKTSTSKRKILRHVWYKDFLYRNITDDYEENGCGFRSTISLCGARMKAPSGTIGTVEYVSPEGKVIFVTDSGRVIEIYNIQQLRSLEGVSIRVGYSGYTNGGEYYRVLRGERNNWQVWSYRYKKLYNEIKDSDIELGTFGDQIATHAGETFKNIQGIKFTILPNKDGSPTGDSDLKIQSERGEIVKSSLYAAQGGYLSEQGMNMRSATVGNRRVWCFGNIINPIFLNMDNSINKAIFGGICGVDGRLFYGTREGMEQHRRNEDIKPEYLPPECTVKDGTRHMQSCGMSAVKVGGYDDNNLAVMFEDKSVRYNVSKEDFEKGKVLPVNEDMLYFIKGYPQEDGGMIYILDKDGNRCHVIAVDTGMEMTDINIDILEAGQVATKLDTDKKYSNKLGMSFSISVDNKNILCAFDDGSLKNVPITNFNPERVYPDYMYNDGDSINIGNVIGVHVVDFKNNRYIFRGVCRTCLETVEGDFTSIFMHRCK